MRLQAKILLLFLSMALLIGGPLLWTVRQTARRVDMDDLAQKGSNEIESLADRLATRYSSTPIETILLPYLQSTQEITGALYVAAFDTQGRVLAHTNVAETGHVYQDANTRADLMLDKPDSHLAPYKDSVVMEVAAPVWSQSASGSTEDFLLSGKPESSKKKRLGAVRLGLPLARVIERENRLFSRITEIVIFAGAIGIFVVFYFMRRMLRPVEWLSSGTARIAQGQYGISVPVHSNDELGDLAKDFNRMSKVLSETTVSKNYLGDILSHMIDPLIVMDMDGILRMVNKAALDLLGYSNEELEGQTSHILFLGKTSISEEAKTETLVGKGYVRNLELEFLTKAGVKIPVLFSSSVLKDEQGKSTGIIAVAKDMSERKKLEGAIRQSEKMSAVGQLAAGVAHEINNPLGVILGFAQAVVRRLQPNDPLEFPLKSIEKEAVRCKILVQDLLTFSRVSKIDREPLDINRAVEGALSLILAQARVSRVEVRKELGTDLPRILGNLNQIQQIIINIANNALDSIGTTACRITIKTESLQEGPLSWVCLRISDTGPGIPAEIQTRIFEPFFTTKGVGKGTGLGLSLVHEIIKKHSGTIEVQSQPGLTEFLVKFPIRSTPTMVQPAKGA